MTERDIEQNPYSPDEERVAKFFVETAGIGGGDDPIGGLLASHEYAIQQRNDYRDAIEAIASIAAISPEERCRKLFGV